jgi:hypothetical protein
MALLSATSASLALLRRRGGRVVQGSGLEDRRCATAARGAHGALLSYGSLPVPVIEWLVLDDDRGLQAVAR